MERAARVDDPLSLLLDGDEDALLSALNDALSSESSPLHPGFELQGEGYGDTSAEKPKKKRRRDRNRPSHEITRLQAEAAELKQELQNQLTTASKRARSNYGSMVQNGELKSLLRQSLEDTRALELNLNKQVEELLQKLPRSMNMMIQSLPYDATQDDSLFRRMASNVDKQYSDMEKVLRLAGLQGGNSEVTDAFICRSKTPTSGNLLKSRTRILSLFASQALVKALWRNVESDEGATLRTKQAATKLDDLPLGLASCIAVQWWWATTSAPCAW